MPSCVLRVSGATSKVREFLRESRLEPDRVFWKGEPINAANTRIATASGFNIQLSSAEGLAAQSSQAARFIRKHRSDLLLIKSLRFLAVSIDFGLYDLATEERPWPSYSVPAPIVELASQLGASIELSFYGAASGAP